MAEESAKLRIPYIAAAQAQKHVTHNEAMTLLDTLVQLSVIDKDLLGPPGGPSEGDCYIVAGGGGTATGAWAGWEKRVARYIDGEWRSYLPGEGSGDGWLAWVQDEDAMYRFDGAAWALAGIEGPQGPLGPAYQPNAVVDAIAGRAAYDDEAAAFSVVVVADSGNDDLPTLYFKLSAGSADWSAGITWLPEAIVPPRGHLFGGTLSYVNAATFGVGVCEAASDDAVPVRLALATAMTKTLASWSAGTGNGALDTGSEANSTFYFVFVIAKPDGTTDILASTSPTAPAMPSGYTYKRRLPGAICNDSGGDIKNFAMFGRMLLWVSRVVEFNSVAAQAETLWTLSVPTGIVVQPCLDFLIYSLSVQLNVQVKIGSAFSGTALTMAARALSSSASHSTAQQSFFGGIFTNTSGQIYFSQTLLSGAPTLSQMFSTGFIDHGA
ncbi:DUF2793 domain-containing protein [Methyloceanibacter methanicus]|uniref:DUF2793 domain-containing protein n=1 Tax=Methyloceanibacter methanicus TaxID=1774968 RepID=UPI000849B6CA|nr:DUF2793 domain-containing protein [Methyloceanibacter methanicus]